MDRRSKILSVLSFLAFIAIWFGVSRMGVFPKYVLPSPQSVVTTFWAKLFQTTPDGSTLWGHLSTSLLLALVGFGMGAVVGIPLGLVMGWYPTVDGLVRPVFDLLRPVPPIAWIPLSILWLGIGLRAKAFIIFLASVVPCVINSYAGIKQTSPVLIGVARTFGASNWECFLRVGVPSALPLVFAGLRVSLGASWMTLVAAELLAATSGLGYMIQMGRQLARADLILTGMLTIGAVGALFAAGLEAAERALWKGGRRT